MLLPGGHCGLEAFNKGNICHQWDLSAIYMLSLNIHSKSYPIKSLHFKVVPSLCVIIPVCGNRHTIIYSFNQFTTEYNRRFNLTLQPYLLITIPPHTWHDMIIYLHTRPLIDRRTKIYSNLLAKEVFDKKNYQVIH